MYERLLQQPSYELNFPILAEKEVAISIFVKCAWTTRVTFLQGTHNRRCGVCVRVVVLYHLST